MSITLLNAIMLRPAVFLSAAVALGLSASLTAGANLASQPPTPKPTIVLVHGAWADASSWNRVSKRLQREGYTVMAPAHPLRGMTSDSAYLASVLVNVPGPIVLVAHSYGGGGINNGGTG